MSDTPASPTASRLASPGWLDGRLVLGVLLVLVSVVVGARVLSSADRSQLVWAATKDLTVGSQLQDGDLEPVRVRLFEQSPRYVRVSDDKPVGYVVRRGLGQGELLPFGSVTRPEKDVDFRVVTVPVLPGHFPPALTADQQVDLWVTPERAGQGTAAQAEGADGADGDGAAGGSTGSATVLRGATQVLSQVTVLTGPRDGGDFASTGSTVAIALQVRPGDVGKVVSAMSLGRLDLVRVPREVEASGDLLPPVEAG